MEKTTITNRNFFQALIQLAQTGVLAYPTDEGDVGISAEELKVWAEKNIVQIDHRNEKAKERSAARKAESDELLEKIYEVLTDEPQMIPDIAAKVEGENVTIARVQNRLSALAKADRAIKSNVTIPGGEGVKARTLVAYQRA